MLEPENRLAVLAAPVEGGGPPFEVRQDGFKALAPPGPGDEARTDCSQLIVAQAPGHRAFVQWIGPNRDGSRDACCRDPFTGVVAVCDVQERHAPRFRIEQPSSLRWPPRVSSPAGGRCPPAKSP